MLNLFKGLKNDLIKYKNINFLYRFDFRSKCYGEYYRIFNYEISRRNYYR